jgi:purine nucleoside permease
MYLFVFLACVLGCLAASVPSRLERREDVIAPKIVIISMFDPEADVWYGIPEFNVLAQNISIPGLSPLYPEVHCTANGEICQFTIGESGKASTILWQSDSR